MGSFLLFLYWVQLIKDTYLWLFKDSLISKFVIDTIAASDSIIRLGRLFTFGTLIEGVYSRQGTYLGEGAYLFFCETTVWSKQNCIICLKRDKNWNCNSNIYTVKVQREGIYLYRRGQLFHCHLHQ